MGPATHWKHTYSHTGQILRVHHRFLFSFFHSLSFEQLDFSPITPSFLLLFHLLPPFLSPSLSPSLTRSPQWWVIKVVRAILLPGGGRLIQRLPRSKWKPISAGVLSFYNAGRVRQLIGWPLSFSQCRGHLLAGFGWIGVKVEKVEMNVGTGEMSVSGVIEEVLVGPYCTERTHMRCYSCNSLIHNNVLGYVT